MHSGRIIAVVQHCRSNVRQEVLLYRQFVKLPQECQCLVFRHAGDKFRQRLSCQAQSFYFITRGFEFCLYLSQHDEGIGNLLLICRCVQPHKSGDCPDLGIRRCGNGAGLSGQLHRNNDHKCRDNMPH
jgi:hypothetical protein